MQTYQSIVIKAPIDKVWSAIQNFHDFSWAEGVIETCQPIGDCKGDQVGAQRLLNGAIKETLRELNDTDKLIKYSIDDGPSPISKKEVSNYVGEIRLVPVTEGNATFVEWKSSWNSKGEEAIEFCHGIYVALLGAMNKKLS